MTTPLPLVEKPWKTPIAIPFSLVETPWMPPMATSLPLLETFVTVLQHCMRMSQQSPIMQQTPTINDICQARNYDKPQNHKSINWISDDQETKIALCKPDNMPLSNTGIDLVAVEAALFAIFEPPSV